jgi:hypothetical protein
VVRGQELQNVANPNQLCPCGLTVNDAPRQFDPSSSFSILDPVQDREIELSVHRVAAGFNSRKPTIQELELYPHYELTSQVPWDPTDGSLAEAESRVVKAAILERASECGTMRNHERLITSVHQYSKTFTSDLNLDSVAHDENADSYDHVIGAVAVAADDQVGNGLDGHKDKEVYERSSEVWKIERRLVSTPEILSRRFGIGLESAKKILHDVAGRHQKRASPDGVILSG